MQFNRGTFGNILKIVLIAVLFYWALENWLLLFQGLDGLLSLLAPFIWGGAVAFMLNVPMRWLERKLFPKPSKIAKFKRPISFLITLICVIGTIALAIFVIVPGIIEAIMSLVKEIPPALERGQSFIEVRLPQIKEFISYEKMDWERWAESILITVKNSSKNIMSSGLGVLGSFVSGMATFLIGIIFAVYILLQKEVLGKQMKQILYAVFPEKKVDKILEILNLTDKTFANFLSGQCLDAAILGFLFFVSMTIFNMPYALLIGVLIAFTALIPVVGAFIGCILGVFLIVIVSPMKAVGFLILFLVLQQIEGNLIYPFIVGSSVGIPSIWVLVAVILGGKLMGILGMLLFIPLFSVAYVQCKSFIKERLAVSGVPPDKWLRKTVYEPGVEEHPEEHLPEKANLSEKE